MATQEIRVLDYLKTNGTITSLEMFQKFFICCPQSVIRNIRRTHKITDEYVTKKRNEVINGKEKKVSVRYKVYRLEQE
jgi:hypothetical protein